MALLVGIALALMIISQSAPDTLERFRSGVTDVVTPIVAFFSRPSATVSDIVDRVESLATLQAENATLKENNERLRKWQTLAQKLQRENDELRAALRVVPDPRASFVTARVAGEAGGPYVRTALLDAGAAEGIKKGQAVLGGDGLVGRIIDVGNSSARVLLVTDLNSRVPVFVEPSRERAVLAGDNSSSPRLEFLAPEAKIGVNDRIVTSGEGGVLPPGLPVGTVAAVEGGGAVVRLAAQWERLEFVSVLDYELPAPLPGTRRAGRIGTLP
ncbi:MAG: rod shape-determining protein MreC [Alphaproteobacteria bacterium]|nr:rod shape-determining protein MreC [Alphaproteobacteria bacterium]